MQKIRLALRVWSRRRQERDREFLARSSWSAAPSGGQAPPPGGGQAPSPVGTAATAVLPFDIEGLTVAYLDGSGRTEYYLDVQTGDVIEATNAQLDSARYQRVPSSSHEEDRHAFIAGIEDAGKRARLSAVESFRAVLASDRALERAWYNFRNDRALSAIEAWLREIGIR